MSHRVDTHTNTTTYPVCYMLGKLFHPFHYKMLYLCSICSPASKILGSTLAGSCCCYHPSFEQCSRGAQPLCNTWHKTFVNKWCHSMESQNVSHSSYVSTLKGNALSQQCYSPPPPSSLVNTPNIPDKFYLTILKALEVEVLYHFD